MQPSVWKLAQMCAVAALWLLVGTVTLAGPEHASAVRSAAGVLALGGLLTVLIAAVIGSLGAIAAAPVTTTDPE